MGVDGCLFIHGIGWIVGVIYVLFVLKKTTGQSLDGAKYNGYQTTRM